MPTYIIKTTDSDLSPFSNFNKEISAGTGTDTGIVIALSGDEIVSGGFITVADKPNSDAWANGGTWTVEIEIDVDSMQINARCRCVRLDSAGNIEETGNYTSTQNLGESRTFSPVAPTWETSGDANVCSDRLAIEIEFDNTNSMEQSVTIGVGTTANEVITDITEDGGSCGGAASESDIVPVWFKGLDVTSSITPVRFVGQIIISDIVSIQFKGLDTTSDIVAIRFRGVTTTSDIISVRFNGTITTFTIISVRFKSIITTSDIIAITFVGEIITSIIVPVRFSGAITISDIIPIRFHGIDIQSTIIAIRFTGQDITSVILPVRFHGIDIQSTIISIRFEGVSAAATENAIVPIRFHGVSPNNQKQIFIGGTNDFLSASTTRWANILSSVVSLGDLQTSEVAFDLIGTPGTLRNLRIDLSVAIVSGSATFTVRKNEVDTGLNVTISSGTSGSNTTTDLIVDAGDRISFKLVSAASTTTVKPRFSVEFEGDKANMFNLCAGGIDTILTSGAVQFNSVMHHHNWSSAATFFDIVAPLNATIKEWFVEITIAPGSGKQWTFEIYKNGSVEASSGVVISDASTSNNVTGLSIDVAPGDTFRMRATPSGSPATGTIARSGIAVQADVNGESWIGGFASNAVPNTDGTTSYRPIASQNFGFTDTESRVVQNSSGPFILKNLRINFNAARGSGKTDTFRLRKNEAPANSIVVLDGTTADGVDSVNIDPYVAGDLITMSHFYEGATSVVFGSWSAIQVVVIDVSSTIVPLHFKGITTTSDIIPVRFIGQNITSAIVPLRFHGVSPDNQKQIFISGPGWKIVNGSTTSFNTVLSSGEASGSNEFPEVTFQLIGTPGTLRNLRIDLDTPVLTGQITFTIRKNKVDTGLQVVITSSDTGSDLTTDLVVVAGDQINMRIVSVGTTTSVRPRFSLEFEGDNDKEFNMSAGADKQTIQTASTQFNTLIHHGFWNTASSDRDHPSPLDGTIKSWYLELDAAPGAGESWTFRIVKGGTSEASSEIVISGTNKTGNVTGLSIDIAPGDKLQMQAIRSSASVVVSRVQSGIAIQADNKNENWVGGWTRNLSPTDDGVTKYLLFSSGDDLWSTNSSGEFLQAIGASYTLKNFRAFQTTSMGGTGDHRRTFNIRKNDAPGNSTLIFIDNDTTKVDTTNTDTFSPGDSISFSALYELLDSGNPNGSSLRWAAIQVAVDVVSAIVPVQFKGLDIKSTIVSVRFAGASDAVTISDIVSIQFKGLTTQSTITPVRFRGVTTTNTIVSVRFSGLNIQSDIVSIQFKGLDTQSTIVSTRFIGQILTSSITPIWFKGLNTASDIISVRFSGEIITSEIVPIRFHGITTTSDIVPVRFHGVASTFSIVSVQFKGEITTSSIVAVRFSGASEAVTISEIVPIWFKGLDIKSDIIPIRFRGITSTDVLISVRFSGEITTSSIVAVIFSGITSVSSIVPVRFSGSITTSAIISVRFHGVTSISDIVSIQFKGLNIQSTIVSVRFAGVTGIVIISDIVSVWFKGINSVNTIIPVRFHGIDIRSDIISVRFVGEITSSSITPVWFKALDVKSDIISIRFAGKITVSDIVALRFHGSITTSSIVSVQFKGSNTNSTIVSVRFAGIVGAATVSDIIPVWFKGLDTRSVITPVRFRGITSTNILISVRFRGVTSTDVIVPVQFKALDSKSDIVSIRFIGSITSSVITPVRFIGQIISSNIIAVWFKSISSSSNIVAIRFGGVNFASTIISVRFSAQIISSVITTVWFKAKNIASVLVPVRFVGKISINVIVPIQFISQDKSSAIVPVRFAGFQVVNVASEIISIIFKSVVLNSTIIAIRFVSSTLIPAGGLIRPVTKRQHIQKPRFPLGPRIIPYKLG